MCSKPHSELFRRALVSGALDIDAFAAELEGLTQAARARATSALTKQDMVRLWEVCEGRPVDARDFVPEGVPLGVEVIHKGKNSLPAFSHFEKRFCRAEGDEGRVYGYNHNWHNFTSTGPGYFQGYHHPDMDAFGLNYYEVPPRDARLPSVWPRIRPNERGLQRFIYAKMIDYMRRIAPGITLGRAWRHGRITDNYFVLTRVGA